MADSFFGFDSTVPSLDGGKSQGLGDELLAEDDLLNNGYDELNDETFGGNGEELDGWAHEEHEQLVGELSFNEFESNGHNGHAIIKGHLHNGDNPLERHVLPPGSRGHMPDSLEDSLSKLVVDDEDELEDPAVMNASKHCPIPTQHRHGRHHSGRTSLDNLFGPASPPGFLNTEHLVSPGHANIWGSPAGRESSVPPASQSLQEETSSSKLLSMLQQSQHQQNMHQQNLQQHPQNLPPHQQNLHQLPQSLPPAHMHPQQPHSQGPSIVYANNHTPQGHQNTTQKPRAITVEELERQMRGEPQTAESSPRPPQFPPMPGPMGTPGGSQSQQQLPPGMLQLRGGNTPGGHAYGMAPHAAGKRNSPPGDVLKQIQGVLQNRGQTRTSPPAVIGSPGKHPGSIYPGHPGHQVQGHPHAHGYPGTPPGPPHGHSPHQGPPPPMGHSHPNTPVGPQMGGHQRAPYSEPPPDHRARSDSWGSRPRSDSYGNRPPPQGVNKNLFPQPEQPARVRPHNQYLQQQWQDAHQQRYQRHDNHGYHDHGYHDHGYHNNRHHEQHDYHYQERRSSYSHGGDSRGIGRGGGGRGGFYHRERSGSFGDGYEQRGGGDDPRAGGDYDNYANLMTQKEKDWVVKIQLLQLHTDKPHIDDYYYTTWMMRKAMKEREKARSLEDDEEEHPELRQLLPHLTHLENRNYKPVQFEGTLGRLTASSVHNPRRIIDVAVNKEANDDEDLSRSTRRFKRLLMEVEQCYVLLLDVDDIEKEILSLPEDKEEGREALLEKRRGVVAQLFGTLSIHGSGGGQPFKSIISVRKGYKLMARSLPVLDPGQLLFLLGQMFANLQPFMDKDMASSECALLYRSVRQVLGLASFSSVVYLTECLQREKDTDNQYITTILKNKFGSSVVWALISRGETIYSTVSPVDMEEAHHADWKAFVHCVVAILGSLSLQDVALPLPGSLQVTTHMARMLDSKAYASVEDHLQKIMKSLTA